VRRFFTPDWGPCDRYGFHERESTVLELLCEWVRLLYRYAWNCWKPSFTFWEAVGGLAWFRTPSGLGHSEGACVDFPGDSPKQHNQCIYDPALTRRMLWFPLHHSQCYFVHPGRLPR
jgi:hypothetical protein